MRADASPLLALLDGSKQFMVPTYQRTYSWTPKQCKQLRDDIIRVGSSSSYSNHFVGSVLYISEEVLALTGVTKISIIDGQQRLTTFSLLLHALAKVLLENLNKEKEHDKIINNFLFNPEEEGDDKYKLYPSRIDREAYVSILEGYNLDEVGNSNIIANYLSLKELIKNNIDRIDDIWKGIEKIYVVRISLSVDQDNPQLIFESMNSTGLALSKAELIKNYLLMGLERREQTRLYDQYRLPMDTMINNNSTLYDAFFRDYLTFKSPSGAIPTIPSIYEKFKDFFVRGGESEEEVLKKIYRAFNNYMKFVGLREEREPKLAEVLKDIKTLTATVAYPLMLELYEDYEEGLLDEDHLVTMLRQIESYVFRRAIVGVPTNSMSRTFATFKRALEKTTSQDYFESFIAHLIGLDANRIFPRDEQFKSSFVAKDIYSLRSSRYLLEKLENFQRRETIIIDNYTIEHIMPQNTKNNETWQRELGDDWKRIYETYLHTIGNITLTGYNSEYSDRSFQEKKTLPEKGFNYSPIGLNGMLRDVDYWTEEAIKTRANTLAIKAARVWEQISLSQEVLEKYIVEEEREERNYEYSDLRYLEGETMELFQKLKKEILAIHQDIREEVRSLYVAFKYQTNFVDIEPQRNGLRMTLNVNIEDITDPQGVCRDVSGVATWGNGNVSFHLRDESGIDYAISLIKQSFEMQYE